MTIAQDIIRNPANKQHHRIAADAEKQINVKISGTRSCPYYTFIDGSSLTVYHTLGDYIVYG